MTPTIELGDWQVYRFNSSRHVLNSIKTTLSVRQEENGDFTARVELSGWDDAIDVAMMYDPTTNDWYGEHESLDFRWALLPFGDTQLLTGYASDRSNSDYRDTFVAVKNNGAIALRDQKIYKFDLSYLTLSSRGKPSTETGSLSVARKRNGKYTLTYLDKTCEIDTPVPYEGGLTVTGGWNLGKKDETRIELWIFSIASTGPLLAIGNFTHRMEMGDGPLTKPGPECKFAVHACRP